MIIVVRYFGGIKLGAGGLTRAYGQAAQAVMEILPVEQQVEMTIVQISCDFAKEQQVRHFVGVAEGLIDSVDYQQQVIVQTSIPTSNIESYQKSLEAMGVAFKVIH